MGGRTGDWVANRLTNRRWQLTVAGCHDGNCESAVHLDLIHRAACRGLTAQLSEIQVAFTLFILAQSCCAGPRIRHGSARGAIVVPWRILVGLSWVAPAGKFAGGALPILCLVSRRRGSTAHA